MTELRILTVRQPWAGAIIHQGKDVENRVRNIAGAYRGTVAIHVALRHDYSAVDALIERTGHLSEKNIYGYGAIIVVVDLVGVHNDNTEPCNGPFGLGTCSSWALPAVWHLELANPRPLSEPIPYRGALGLRRLPDDVADAVRKAAS